MLSKAVRVQNKSLLSASVSLVLSLAYAPRSLKLTHLVLPFSSLEGNLRGSVPQQANSFPQIDGCCRQKDHWFLSIDFRSGPAPRGK